MQPDHAAVSEAKEKGASTTPVFTSSLPMAELVKKWPMNMPKIGSLVEGVVVAKEGNSVFIDLGSWRPGIIYGKEYMEAGEMIRKLKVGDTISAKVIELENEGGYTELSVSEAGRDRTWDVLATMKEKGTIISTKILEANRGGLLVEVEGVKGFLPVSQLSGQKYPRVEGGDKQKILSELQKYVGELFEVRVIDVDPREEKLIVSEKEVIQQDVRDALAQYGVGDVIEGEVSGVVDFGAFVKFGGNKLEGLIHISELDHKLIEDPRKIVKAGDKIRAKIIGIEEGRVSLSLKALKEDPWLRAEERYHKDDRVIGEVTKINKFGAFVRLDPDIHGLAHISEFAGFEGMHRALEVGKQYPFRIRSIEPAQHRLALSPIREGKEQPATAPEAAEAAEVQEKRSGPPAQ